MATAAGAGVMAYVGATGAGYATSTAVALAVLAAGATYVAEEQQKKQMEDMRNQQQIQLGMTGTPFEKTTPQEKADIAELDVGEDEGKKAKRKRGKAAFKIELSKEARKKAEAQAEQGIQVSRPEDVGVQL
jgi:hypothetical protein